MEIREEFLKKIEEEYNSYKIALYDYSGSYILMNSEYIAKFEMIYNYLSKNNILTNKEMIDLMKVDKLLDLITCHSELNVDKFLNTIDIVAETICENQGSSCDEKTSINEFFNTILDEIKKDNASDAIERCKEMYREICSVPSWIGNSVIETLLQFKEPLKVVLSITPNESNVIEALNQTAKYIDSQDIYTLPYELNHSKITSDAKFRHKAFEDIIKIVPQPDHRTTIRWLTYFREDAIMAGLKKDVDLYCNFTDTLKEISAEYGECIMQQLYNMGRKCVMYRECLMVSAKYLADGGNIINVPQLAYDGILQKKYCESKEQQEV